MPKTTVQRQGEAEKYFNSSQGQYQSGIKQQNVLSSREDTTSLRIMDQTSRKLVHRDHWNSHLVEIFDKGNIRSLYFAGNILQSAMSIPIPHKLVLSYTQFMMATLLFNNHPRDVLIIGLGAGSLLRFLNHHFHDCHIDAVDNSDHIITLAKEFFSLPNSTHINLRCSDGLDFISHNNKTMYDLILVDAFDQRGMSPSIYCSEFFMHCNSHLKKDGLVSLNMWSGDNEKMESVKSDLSCHFGSVLKLPVPNRGNVICIAGKDENLADILEQDHMELIRLNKKMQINFKKIIKVCNKNNLGFRQRISKIFT